METSEVKKIVEALLFAADQPINDIIIKSILGDVAKGRDIEAMIKEIGDDYAKREGPIELRFIAGGWQLSTKKNSARGCGACIRNAPRLNFRTRRSRRWP